MEFEYDGRKYIYDGADLYSAHGTKLSGTYRHFKSHFKGRTLQVARVIWEGVVGEIPEGMEIDHISGNPMDNRLENLRCITKGENLKNKRAYPNKTGISGIGTYTLASGEVRYRAGIRNPQTSKVFKTLEEAVEFIEALYEKHGYHPNHGRER